MTDSYAVIIVQPPGYPHWAAFAEVAHTLVAGLRGLGHQAELTSAPVPGRRGILLGSNLLARHPMALPADTILYNLEQVEPGSPWLTPSLLELFRRHPVWDYSERNAQRYAELGLPRPAVVPVGYMPELQRIAPAAEDIDVLFYGSVNERRRQVLEALVKRGLKVEVAFGVYGAARDALIARSKVVLNVHYFEAKVFEVVRVSYLLANSRCVVCECGADPGEDSAFDGGVIFAPYQGLVEACVRVCADTETRARVAAAGHRLFLARDERAYLKKALSMPVTPASSRPAAAELSASYYQHSRPEVVARASPAGQRVLDVGCAAGAMGAAMLTAGAAEVVGLEVHPPAAAIARARLTAVYRADVEQLPLLPYPDGYFEVITFADVLEHLKDPLAVLRHLRRWLADGGRIVCSMPNVRHESVLLPLLRDGRWDYADAGVLDRTHLRFFTVESMGRLLREAGFEVDGPAETVTTPPSPSLQAVAALVKQLGGDAHRFLDEAQVVQVLMSARPAEATRSHPVALDDAWRGSKPVRVLVTPDLNDPSDRWAPALDEVVTALGKQEGISVGVALPRSQIDAPPQALCAVAEKAGVDFLLTEAPSDAAGWERLFGGASLWVATANRPELTLLAQRVGIDIQDCRSPAA